MHTLKNEALQRGEGRCLIDSTLQDFLDTNYRDDEPAASKACQQPSGRAIFASAGFAIESDEEGTIQKHGTAQRFLCAIPSPFPSEAFTHSIKSS
ncbi:MAG TPA: hypothetical protein VGJ82_07330, partial [Thermoanaerobaculia bacterium]